MPGFKQQLNQLNQQINNFFNFIINKIKNFKNLSRGEQIAFLLVGFGLILILVALIMFIL